VFWGFQGDITVGFQIPIIQAGANGNITEEIIFDGLFGCRMVLKEE